ncbi:MAG: C39 family peptidase [Planctomycetes bacterium]|nr:C39 family peptidase [Planctomycetota bacterium]
MRIHYLAMLFAILSMVPGCGETCIVTAAPAAVAETDAAAPRLRPSVLIPLPQTRQATPYTCGVAVVQSILGYNGVLIRQDILEEKLGATPEWGTSPHAMIECLAEHGIGATIVENMGLAGLRSYIDAGKPVVCFLQAWNGDPDFDYSTGYEDGHYAIAIGYDAERIYFMDPSTLANYAYIDNDAFVIRWHDGDAERQVYETGIVVTNINPVYQKDAFKPML